MTIDILPQGKAKYKKVAIKIYYADTSFFLRSDFLLNTYF